MNSPKEKLSFFPSGDTGVGAGTSTSTSSSNLHKLRTARRHDTRNFHVTLKQWRALHAVVDCGGFCEAAQSLHLSQSSVSYAVAKLQEQFGIPLLRISGRKAELTEQGRALLERSRNLLCDAMELEQFADNLRRGALAPVRVAVDPDFPPGLLLRAQRCLAERGHDVALTSNELAPDRIEDALRSHRADLAVTSRMPAGLDHVALLQVEYVAVSHPQHRLCRLQRPLHADELETELEIQLARHGETHAAERNATLSARQPRWQVGSTDNAIQALREGVGYAWLPRHLVQPWLERGTLALLPICQGGGRIVRLFLSHACPPAPGSRVRLLADMLRSLAQGAAAPVMQQAVAGQA
jgi:DNA-binding transcriptional LysR family regulator